MSCGIIPRVIKKNFQRNTRCFMNTLKNPLNVGNSSNWRYIVKISTFYSKNSPNFLSSLLLIPNGRDNYINTHMCVCVCVLLLLFYLYVHILGWFLVRLWFPHYLVWNPILKYTRFVVNNSSRITYHLLWSFMIK